MINSYRFNHENLHFAVLYTHFLSYVSAKYYLNWFTVGKNKNTELFIETQCIMFIRNGIQTCESHLINKIINDVINRAGQINSRPTFSLILLSVL